MCSSPIGRFGAHGATSLLLCSYFAAKHRGTDKTLRRILSCDRPDPIRWYRLSLGGMVAQQLGAEYPDLLRRIILLGTGPVKEG
jgi:pimeloyl-ACP methyl ester carboxylesterase